MLEVKVRDSRGGERSQLFDKPSVMIGRAAGNDIVIDEGGVSRYHAMLSVDGEAVSVRDNKSTNGTFVDTVKVECLPVSADSRITIGAYTLAVRWIPPLTAETESARETGASEAAGDAPSAGLAAAANGERAQEGKVETSGEERAVGSSAENRFYWEALRSFLAPIWEYLRDDTVTEIAVNGAEQIYVERKGKLEKSSAKFTPDQLRAAVLNIAQFVGRRVDESEPYLDARLPDGSRVAVLLPPCSRRGITVSIRKFSPEQLTLEKLVECGSLTPEMVAYLRAAVILRKSIIVSGGTSSGKTSLLNVISGLIPDEERILTIEDSAELQLRQEHVVPMETRPPDKKGRGEVSMRDLVRASLRMRPDRIIVGEIRGGEAIDLLQAMNTGHSGSMATVHASSSQQALTRLETLALFSGLDIPIRALREQVASAVEVVVQAARLPDHSRKVAHISEVLPLTEGGNYCTQDIFRFETCGRSGGKIVGNHARTDRPSLFQEEMVLAGLGDVVDLLMHQRAGK